MASTVAVQRKYEYMRRQWKDEEDDSRKEMQKVTAKRKKYRARRKRVCSEFFYSSSYLMTIFNQKYDTRGLVVHGGEEQSWRQLTIDYMSEESDDPADNQSVVVHPLQWRSKS